MVVKRELRAFSAGPELSRRSLPQKATREGTWRNASNGRGTAGIRLIEARAGEGDAAVALADFTAEATGELVAVALADCTAGTAPPVAFTAFAVAEGAAEAEAVALADFAAKPAGTLVAVALADFSCAGVFSLGGIVSVEGAAAIWKVPAREGNSFSTAGMI